MAYYDIGSITGAIRDAWTERTVEWAIRGPKGGRGIWPYPGNDTRLRLQRSRYYAIRIGRVGLSGGSQVFLAVGDIEAHDIAPWLRPPSEGRRILRGADIFRQISDATGIRIAELHAQMLAPRGAERDAFWAVVQDRLIDCGILPADARYMQGGNRDYEFPA